MTLTGELSLWVAVVLALWAVVVAATGARLQRNDLMESAERAVYACASMLLVSSAVMCAALLARDFSLAHVASMTTTNLPYVYTLSALWRGPRGFGLFAATLAALAAAASTARLSRERPTWTVYAAGVSGGLAFLLMLILVLAAYPYARLDWVPNEGQGMDPRFQNIAAVLYPLVLVAAYAVYVVPLTTTASALLKERTLSSVPNQVRRWTAAGWFLNTAGILLTLWWAHASAATDRDWLLAPLRNGSLLPWLVSSAVLAHMLVPRMRPFAKTSAPDPVATRTLDIGRYVAVAGAVAIVAALAGAQFSTSRELTLGTGQGRTARDPFGNEWRFVSQGVSHYDVINRRVTAIALDVSRDGKRAGVITAARRQYVDGRGAPTFPPYAAPGVHTAMTQNIRATLVDLREDDSASIVRVNFTPLVQLLWIGGSMLAIAGFWSAWTLKRT